MTPVLKLLCFVCKMVPMGLYVKGMVIALEASIA